MAEANGNAAIPADMPIRVADTLATAPTPTAPTASTATDVPAITADEIGHAWRESGEHWQRVVAWLATRRQAQRQRARERQEDDPFRSLALEGRTITLNGYGAGLFVQHDCLVVKQGRSFSTQEATTETLTRGVHGVTALVWITNGGAGSLSVQALKWCASQNITVTMLTERGECLAVIRPSPYAPATLGIPGQENGRPDIALRRAQYNLAPSGKDVALARWLITRKIAAQHQTAHRHKELPDRQRALDATEQALSWLQLDPPPPFLTTLDGIRLLEARAAQGYFRAWQGLPLRVDAKAQARWSTMHAHWLTIGPRFSALTRYQSPRNATNPPMACLNFLYGCLEAQVRRSLHAIGADVVCGILHADKPQNPRDNLVLDAMEPLRANVDSLFLSFLGKQVFGLGDFQARSDGSIAIHPSLCRVLAESCRVEQRKVDDEARALRAQVLTL